MGYLAITETIIGTAVGGLIASLILGGTQSDFRLTGFPQFTTSDSAIIIVGILGLIIFGGVLFYGQKKGTGFFTFSFNDYKNYITIATIDHSDVKWEIGMPYPRCSNKSQLHAKLPPRCPECQTELDQEKSKVGGYVWKCVRCNFKKRNKKSYWAEQEGVEKIARRLWEEGKIR